LIKVLHISTALSWRGGEQQIAYLIDELKDRVHSIVLCSKGSKIEEHCLSNKIEHYAVKKAGGINFRIASKIKKLCIEHQIDCCHLHDAHAHTHAVLSAIIYNNAVPLILSRRVDFPIKKAFTSIYKYNHSKIYKILCVSKMIKEITAKGIKEQNKLEVVYSGVDLNKIKARTGKLRLELGIGKESFLIGNTSALADHKDYFTFIDTAEKVIQKHSNAYFVIIGDGPMREEIKNYAANKKLSDRLTFLGFRTDITEILADLDLFFISSKTEGLGTSILDAFAAKIPVIATKAGGIPELVEHEVTGYLSKVGDSESLSDGIAQLMDNETLRHTLIEGATKKAIEFSKKNMADNTFKYYLEALESNSNPNRNKL